MKSENLLKEFGAHIKAIRLEKNLSQEKLALVANLDRTYISGIERGIRNISLINIFKLAEALNLPASELFKFGDH